MELTEKDEKERINSLIIEQSKDEAVIKKLKDEIAKGGDVDVFKKTLSEIEGLISYISIISEGDNKKKEKNRLSSLKSWVVKGGLHPDDKKKIKKSAEKRDPNVVKLDDITKLYIYVDSVKKTTEREISRIEAGLPKEVVKKSDVERLEELQRKAAKLAAKIKLEEIGNTSKKTMSFINVSSGDDKTVKSVQGLERLTTLIQFISKDLQISELDLIKSSALHLKKGDVSRNYTYRFLEINKGIKLTASANDLINSFSDGKVPDGFNELSKEDKAKIKNDLKAAQETKAWLDQLASTSNNSVILF